MNQVIKSMNKLLGMAAVILVAGACRQDTSENAVAAEPASENNVAVLTGEQLKIANVRLGKVEEKQISGTIKANGVLDVPPQQLVSISSPMGGFLKGTSLLQGSKVSKGQLIATVENLDFIQLQQEYVEAKGNFELAKADYERQQQLAKENVNSEKSVQQSKATFTNWQAKYSGFREKMKMLNMDVAAVERGELSGTISLYAPISGYVTAVNVNIGKYVLPSDVLFEIVDTEHLHAELTVFEKDVPKLRIGQKVRFTLANETKERTATIYLIGREISEDRTIRIHCHIDKEDKELLPGMYLMALVETGDAVVPSLPEGAIVNFQGAQYIFVAEKESTGESHRFLMVEIRTGDNQLGYTEVTLPEGRDWATDQIVVSGAYTLLSTLKNQEEEE